MRSSSEEELLGLDVSVLLEWRSRDIWKLEKLDSMACSLFREESFFTLRRIREFRSHLFPISYRKEGHERRSQPNHCYGDRDGPGGIKRRKRPICTTLNGAQIGADSCREKNSPSRDPLGVLKGVLDVNVPGKRRKGRPRCGTDLLRNLALDGGR